MEYENIVFDMGNVLIKYQPVDIIRKLTQNQDEISILLDEVFKSLEWVMIDHGAISEEEAIDSCCKRIPKHLHNIVKILYESWSSMSDPIDGMDVFIKKVKNAGYSIYILSNTSKRYYQFRNKLPAIELFNGEFISADCKLLKPDIEIYKKFCNYFSINPESCLFIDDTPINVYNAKQIGMDGIIFNGNVNNLERQFKAKGINL